MKKKLITCYYNADVTDDMKKIRIVMKQVGECLNTALKNKDDVSIVMTTMHKKTPDLSFAVTEFDTDEVTFKDMDGKEFIPVVVCPKEKAAMKEQLK